MSEKKIITKKPPYKESIGAQYYNFNKPEEGMDFDLTKYEDETIKNESIKTITITESSESTPIYGSGKVYDTRQQTSYIDIEVETLATDIDDLCKMRGDTISEHGLIQDQASGKRPYFAYGKVVLLSNNNKRFDWYPKCQLVDNTDEAKTTEESFSEQSDTLTIRAYAFDEEGKTFKNSIDTSSTKFPKGVTEDLYFKQVITCDEDLVSIIPS